MKKTVKDNGGRRIEYRKGEHVLTPRELAQIHRFVQGRGMIADVSPDWNKREDMESALKDIATVFDALAPRLFASITYNSNPLTSSYRLWLRVSREDYAALGLLVGTHYGEHVAISCRLTPNQLLNALFLPAWE